MTDELSDDTERFMFDYMKDIGGLPDKPVDDCVRDVVLEMREHHVREYDVSTQALVEAAYDVAIHSIRDRKQSDRSRELVGEIEKEVN